MERRKERGDPPGPPPPFPRQPRPRAAIAPSRSGPCVQQRSSGPGSVPAWVRYRPAWSRHSAVLSVGQVWVRAASRTTPRFGDGFLSTFCIS